MKESNVYLARLVSFDYPTVVFKKNELADYIDREIYRLVVFRKDWAYDLITFSRYYIITNAMGEIDDRQVEKIKPDTFYMVQSWPIIGIWENVKDVYGITGTLDSFTERAIEKVDELDKLLSPKDKVIQLDRVKEIMMVPNINNND